MTISTDSILDALKSGTYSLSTLIPTRFFKTQLPQSRIRYPCVLLLETPTGNTATQEDTNFVRSFDVRIYLGLRGGSTTGQTNTISTLENLEKEILEVLENTPILEHKLTINEREWSRDYRNNELRPYVVSTLTIKARQITGVLSAADGILVFDVSQSNVDNPPILDYQYSEVFNTDISSGYRDFDEFTTESSNPNRYSGGFEGSFITNVRVNDNDLGTTGEKLNQLNLLNGNGEKATISFIYTDKTDETPTTITIKNALKITVDNVKEVYRANGNTVFRIIGKLLQPKTLTTS